MKQIEKDELFEHFNEFLKNKGIEVKEGSYAQGIQKGFSLLTDAINVSQQGIQRAAAEIDKKLDQMRQVIHEKTAPKPAAKPPAAPKPSANGQKAAPRAASQKSQAKSKQKPAKSRPKPSRTPGPKSKS